MKMIIQTISSKGQIVIPAQFREHLALEKGAKIIMTFFEDKKEILLSPVVKDPVDKVAGILSPTEKSKHKDSGFKKMLQNKYKEMKNE